MIGGVGKAGGEEEVSLLACAVATLNLSGETICLALAGRGWLKAVTLKPFAGICHASRLSRKVPLLASRWMAREFLQ